MKTKLPRLAALALAMAGLVLASSPSSAQIYPSTAQRPQIIPYPVNRNAFVAPNVTLRQAAYNTAVLGRAISQVPPYAFGFNPYPSPVISAGPAIATPFASVNPYALSTLPSANPYLGGSAALSSSPYSLSTVPGGGYGTGGTGFSPFYSPYSGFFPQDPFSQSLQGLASLTAATGQYYKDVQQARITREQSRQMALDTAKKRVELALWYDSVRPKAPQFAAQERATALDRARNGAPSVDVWSGVALNTLLDNLVGTPLRNGKNVPLEEDTLKNINVTGGTSAGNVGMLRDGVKLSWPDALLDENYDESRKRLERDLRRAVDLLKDKERMDPPLLRSIRKDFNTISDRVSRSADDLSPNQYIETKRFLNQLNSAIRALSDPKASNYFNNTWNARGKNVAELVKNMQSSGLRFAPSTPGDEASYTALYQALREFDASITPNGGSSAAKPKPPQKEEE